MCHILVAYTSLFTRVSVLSFVCAALVGLDQLEELNVELSAHSRALDYPDMALNIRFMLRPGYQNEIFS